MQRRVLAGLGLVTLVIGVDLALAWRDTSPLYVLGGVLLGGIAGEALGIEERLQGLGDRVQRRGRGGRGGGPPPGGGLFSAGPVVFGGAPAGGGGGPGGAGGGHRG